MRNQVAKKQFSGLRNESGQSLLEYILIMVIMVAVVVGVLLQFNRAFETYANNMFGEYLTCLLETGELPSLGSTEDNNSVCAEFFGGFEPSGGSINPGERTDGAGSSGDSGNGSDSRGNQDGRRNQRRVSESRGGGGGGSRSSRGGRFGRIGGYKPSRSGGANSGRSSSGKGKDIYTGSTGSSSDGFGYARGGAPKRFAAKGLDSGFGYSSRKKDEERDKPIPTRNKRVKNKRKDRPEIFKVERAPAKNKDIEVDDSGFSFAGFLRWLIILGIIIAIVLFFGGQALQISKSMD